MRLSDLRRSTSFRLALGVSLFILGALIVAGGAGYWVMHRTLTARQEARVTEAFAALAAISLQDDEQDLIDAVTTRITASPDRTTLYLLKDAEGAVLAGNMRDIAVPEGWSIVLAEVLGVPTDYPFRVYSGPAGDYWLVVGLTDADLDDLREIILGTFGWSALAALLAAMGAGAVLAAGVQRRLALVDTTLNHVAQGDLAARMPVTPRGDDIDRISVSINDMLARLGAQVEAMRQVSTDIAHDLRTPLNRLRIRIEEAAGKSASGQPVDDDLAAAMAESETIDATFAALLRIAQIEAGARRERFAALDLSGVLDVVADVYADVAEDAGMTLIRQRMDQGLVHGDKDLLTQMFANLIENAIRHCPSGTVITCGVTADGQSVRATVADTGPGISKAERSNVLRRLYRLEKSRSTAGSGLGLSLVKAVADLHGAQIVLSDAGPGLCVSLTFQCLDPDHATPMRTDNARS